MRCALIVGITWSTCLAMHTVAFGQDERPAGEASSPPSAATLATPVAENAGRLGDSAGGGGIEGTGDVIDPGAAGEGYIGPYIIPMGEYGALGGRHSRYLDGGGMILVWSEKFDVAWGFSKRRGKWSLQRLDPPGKQPPVAGGDVAFIQTSKYLYAFSAELARWDRLELPEQAGAAHLLDQSTVMLFAGDRPWVFAASSGRWTTPSYTGGPAATGEAMGMGFDPYGGGESSAKFSGPAGMGLEFSQLVAGNPGETPADAPRPAGDDPSAWRLGEYQRADGVARALAQQVREYESKGETSKALRDELQRAVLAAFVARQQWQHAEIAELTSELDRLKQLVGARESEREEIVARRVDQLLHPQFDWDAHDLSGRRAGGAGDRATASDPDGAAAEHMSGDAAASTDVAQSAPEQGTAVAADVATDSAAPELLMAYPANPAFDPDQLCRNSLVLVSVTPRPTNKPDGGAGDGDYPGAAGIPGGGEGYGPGMGGPGMGWSPVTTTGFFVSEDGLVITDLETVTSFAEPAIRFRAYDGVDHEADVVALDKLTGLCVLRSKDQVRPTRFFSMESPAPASRGLKVYSGQAFIHALRNAGTHSFVLEAGSQYRINNPKARLPSFEFPWLELVNEEGAVSSLPSGACPLFDSQGRLVGAISHSLTSRAAAGVVFAVPTTRLAELLTQPKDEK